MSKPEYYKINSEHIAIVTINEQTKKAELDFIQIERIENDHYHKLFSLVDKLKSYLPIVDDKNISKELIIDSLKDKCYEIDSYFRENDIFKRLHQSFKVCLTQKEVKKDHDKNNQIYQTFYGNAYEGFDPFGDPIRLKIDELEEEHKKQLIKFDDFLAKKDGLIQQNEESIKQFQNIKNREELVDEKQKEVISELKTYANSCMSIPIRKRILEYKNTINSECILNPYVRAYSNKDVGYHTYKFNIGNEYKAIINCNLGYGSASYFLLTISYKDVKLTPYSKYVTYYLANKTELHSYTKQTYLYDAEWGVLFQYVIDTYNLALVDPDKFIDKYFIGELNQMVVGLEDIAYFDKNNGFYEINEMEIYFSNYEKKTLRFLKGSFEFDYFQLQKISGALEYVESIEKLKEISDVQKYIDRIIRVNKYILKTSKIRLEQVEGEIPILEDQIKKESEILDSLNASLKQLIDNKLEVIVNGKYSNLELKNIYLEKYSSVSNIMFEGEISKFSKDLLIDLAGIILRKGDEKDYYNDLRSKINKKNNDLYTLRKTLNEYNDRKRKFVYGISIIEKYFDANSIV